MTAHEDFHKTDPTGLLTLERFARANQFNRWLFESIAPFCKGNVLEIGSGIGNLSGFFLKKGFLLTATDLRTEYCRMLKKKFGNDSHLRGVEVLDLSHEDFDHIYAHLQGQFDTVVALNVVEHIEQDAVAVRNAKSLLRPGGHFIILVPAYQPLYNAFDRELGHCKRYNSRSLSALLTSQQLEVLRIYYFNAAGIVGWVLNGSLRNRKLIPSMQLKVFNQLVPLFRLIDTVTGKRFGLSVIGIGKKI